MFAIPHCSTVKKARAFLEQHKIDYTFIDFKKNPPTRAQIQAWSAFSGELPINKRGQTYRKYKDQYDALSLPEQIDFIIANTSLIKRPVLTQEGSVIALGFNEEEYHSLLNRLR